MRKTAFFWMVMASIFLLALSDLANGQKLRLEISLSKETYLTSEPIWLDLTLTNVSSDTVRIFGPCVHCGDTRFQVINQKADTLPYVGIEAVVAYGPGQLMDLGEKKFNCFNVIEYYGEKGGLFRIAMSRFKLKPDSYSIRAIYGGSREGGVISPALNFEVEEPTGAELQALNLLEKGYDTELSSTPEVALECYKDLVHKFPKSVYVEAAYNELASTDSLKVEMLRKFPDSGFSKRLIQVVTNHKKPAEQTRFLHRIIKDHPGTRSAKFAEKELKIITKKEGLK